ncbi:MAG TPA: hypothetical protein VJ963_07535, partial [Bacteroidales bacterium]|nr:hypothetical protein [Bacteroidales bacterium]
MKNIFTQRIINAGKNIIKSVILLFILWTIPTNARAGVISGTFTTLASCPMNMTSFTVNPSTGLFYGQGDRSTNYYRYDASTNTWTTLASCPVNSGNNGGATYLNGKIYSSYCSLEVLTIYDIASDSWTTVSGGVPTGDIATDGTDIYVSGNNNFKKYIVSSGTWVSLTGTSCQPWGGLQYKNGYFYLHEGNGRTGFKRYNVATDTWEDLPNVPDGAVLGSAIYDAYYYCQGSYGGTNLYSYDLGAGEWNNTLTLPFTTNDAAIITYGNSLYICQGEAGPGFTKFTPNNPLLMDIEGTAIEYSIGNPSVTVTSTMTASQNSGTNFTSATVKVSKNYEAGKDVLSFTNAFGITGSWNSATGILTLSGVTSIANYQAALRSIHYSNDDLTSSSATRTISMQVSDGEQLSNTASRDIIIVTYPAVTTTAISSITTGSAVSGGNVTSDGNGTVTARGICWSTSPSPTLDDNKTSNGTGTGVFTSSMGDLSAETQYYVRAYATNSLGTSYGEEISFYTRPANPTSVTAESSSICSGTSVQLTAVGSSGTVYWYTGGCGESLVTTGNPVNVSPESTTTYYARNFKNDIFSSGCASVTINVTQGSVGGTVSGAESTTYGSSTGEISLASYTGDIQKWQKKLGDGSWSDIDNTGSTYTENPGSAG